MCKTLLSSHSKCAIDPASGLPLELIALCARQALVAVHAACCGPDGWDAGHAQACAAVLEAETLPQAARWHRRDLVPALLAAWRAVLRALARGPGPAHLGACEVLPREQQGA